MTSSNLEPYSLNGFLGINKPEPNLKDSVDMLRGQVENATNTYDDPAFATYQAQMLQHIRHVSLTFSFPVDGEYPHPRVLATPLPNIPTRIQLTRGHEFLRITSAGNGARGPAFTDDRQAMSESLLKEQQLLDDKMISNPLVAYANFQERISESGLNSVFPEFLPTLRYLIESASSGRNIKTACIKSPIISQLRSNTIARLETLEQTVGDGPEYLETLQAIEDAMAFFDIVARTLGNFAPLYHSHKYEYFFHFLTSQPDHILYPTISAQTMENLIRVRPAHIGIIGVKPHGSWADGFEQSPYEYFYHDLDHARRRYQLQKERAREVGQSDSDYQTASYKFTESCLAAFSPQNGTDRESQQILALGQIVLFELLNENALPADPELIKLQLMREPGTLTPFERIDADGNVEYFMEQGPSPIASVFRKLAHVFYDSPGNRAEIFGDVNLRSRENIAQAACVLFAQCVDRPYDKNAIYHECVRLVRDDRGLPEALRKEIELDITHRGLGRGLMLEPAIPENIAPSK